MSLLATRMQNLRAQANLDKNEIRPSRYGALDVFQRQTSSPTGILTEQLRQQAESSIGRTVEVPVIENGEVNISNTRTVTIEDAENTSRLVQVTFSTLSWGFTEVPSAFLNNEISLQRDFNAKFMKCLYAVAKKLDEMALATIEANKTTVFADQLGYTVEAGALKAPWSDRESIIGDINPLMAANDFYGQLDVVGNSGIESLIRKLAEKGLYNEVNKQLEYSDKILHFTNALQNEDGQYGTGFAIEADSLGMLFRFEREVVLGTKTNIGYEWGKENLPLINIPVGTYYYESVGDFSGIAGAATADNTRAFKRHYGFSVDVAFLTAFNSDPEKQAQPILKFQIASGTARDTKNVVIVNDSTNPVVTKTV